MNMKHNFCKIASLSILASMFILAACVDRSMDNYVPVSNSEMPYNDFDFSTTNDSINLTVSYVGCGIKTPVYFEIYEENPLEGNEEGSGYTKREDLKPLFTSYTGENCIFNGQIKLPSYLEKVWIYSPSFFAKTLMEADIVGNNITVSDTNGSVSSATTRSTSEAGFSYMTRTDVPKEYQAGKRWKEWLGTYDANGKINYAYKGNDLVPDASLYDIHSQIINANQLNCPQKYRVASDLEISEPAQVVVTFLGGNTCWNSSMGYYYYKVGQEPKSIDDVNVVMLFPNTQDGQWFKMTQDAEKRKAGINRMTAVKLMYYPNIANDSQEGATDVFPAGYKVGLILATNAWSKRLEYNGGTATKIFLENRYYRSASLTRLCARQNATGTDQPLVASYYTKGRDFIIASFEDDYKFEDGKGNDQNFSDVVLAIGTNPVSSIASLPVYDNRMNADGSGLVTLHENVVGTYLFEDLWPNKGDYDLNDACVEYTYGRAYDKWNDTYGETFSFKPRENYATKKNGIAFRVIGGIRDEVNSKGGTTGKKISGYHVPAEVKMYIGGKDVSSQLEYDVENQIYYVIPDTKKNPGTTYTVEFNHIPEGSPKYYERNYKNYKSEIDVFLYRKEGNYNWEVHTPNGKPTPKMDYSYFATGDDLSRPDEGIYYVRNGNFPFAIYLSGMEIDKFGKIFELENEGKSFDIMFPSYVKWVESKGQECTGWYR
ncbi:MAG: LruC domain-containing protein [Prevotella sp.]